MAVTDLSPILQQRRDLDYQYGMNSANNAFDKAFFARRGSRSMDDFSRGFNRQLPSFVANQTQRGLGGGGIQSGVMNRAMRDYVGAYTRNMGRMMGDYNLGMARFDQNQTMFDENYLRTARDLQMEQADRIAATADMLTALKPLIGGYS
jgi:hypothetical protein